MTYNITGKIEIKTIGDSRGYLWRIIIDKHHGIGKLERISGIHDNSSNSADREIYGKVLHLKPETDLHDDMKNLADIIESRFEAA